MDGILSERSNIARRDYYCTLCDRFIVKGEKYTRAFWRPEWMHSKENPIDAKFCARCYTPAAKLTVPPKRGETDGYEYIRQYYGVPVKVGQKITVGRIPGTVARALDMQHYVHFIPDGVTLVDIAHPTYETVYYNDDGTIAADYRTKPVTA